MKQVKNFNLDFYEFVSVNNFVKDEKENLPTGLQKVSSVKSRVDA